MGEILKSTDGRVPAKPRKGKLPAFGLAEIAERFVSCLLRYTSTTTREASRPTRPKMTNNMQLFCALFFALALPLVLADAWNSRNDPDNFGAFFPSGIDYNLNTLPTSARLSVVPWADTYWPSYLSGIAYRWASSDPESFNYTFYTKAQLQSMSPTDLQELSPAGKSRALLSSTATYNSRYRQYREV